MNKTPLDNDAQPVNPFFNQARRVERDLSELLGLAKAMLCDGDVVVEEAAYLHAWAGKHPDAVTHWPTNLIFNRLHQQLEGLGRFLLVRRVERRPGPPHLVRIGHACRAQQQRVDPLQTGPGLVFLASGDGGEPVIPVVLARATTFTIQGRISRA